MTDSVAPITKPKRERLAFLDGLRGVAALYVVCFHIWASVRFQNLGDIPMGLRIALSWSSLGRSAVCAFIVLSGFCLMLPVVRSEGILLRGGFRGYLKRRTRRILPPYFAALILSVGLAWVMEPYRNDARVFAWFAPPPTIVGIAAHLTLTHNLSVEWIWQFNAPLWTIATEWQIYLLFPLILLPVWRRCGMLLTVGIAFALGMLPDTLCPELTAASFWFIGLFAFGMASAATLRNSLNALNLRRIGVCGFLAFATFLALTAICEQRGMKTQSYDFPLLWLADTLIGIAAACFLVIAAHRPNKAVRLLARPICQRLGKMSYSLYLLHFPIITDLAILPVRRHWNALDTTLFLYGVALPVTLLTAYGFSRIVEQQQYPPPN